MIVLLAYWSFEFKTKEKQSLLQPNILNVVYWKRSVEQKALVVKSSRKEADLGSACVEYLGEHRWGKGPYMRRFPATPPPAQLSNTS
jgi:hypothetical protein